MADEQTIYLSPEEELTSVRERLERTQARRITLIIPQQTQLRSHVGWRLIHARMRELGKELVVISPDRQVRAVARAAGFQVAETQETPSQRPRLGNSNTRQGNLNTRGGARARPDRFGSESQTTQRRRPTPNTNRRPPVSPPPGIDFDEEEATIERPRKKGQDGERKPPVAPLTLFEEPEERFGPAYDFHIDTTPSIQPVVPQGEEEVEDLKYYKDYHTARTIRESASEGHEPEEHAQASSSQPEGPSVPAPSHQEARAGESSPAVSRGADPYAYLEDDAQYSSLPEQKGSLSGPLEELDAGVPDISDRSTEIMQSEIEDLGDMGALDLPEWLLAPPTAKPAERESEPEPRPRRRTGQMQPQERRSPRAPRPGAGDFSDDEDLLALPTRPMQTGTPPGRSSRNLAGAPPMRPSGQLTGPPPAPRPPQASRTGAAAQAGSPPPTMQRPPGRSLVSVPGATARSSRKPRRGNRGLTIAFVVLVLLLAVGGLLFYLVPSATVTITLQAQKFNQAVQLNATLDPQANASNQVATHLLQQDFSASGQGTATGSTKVGNAQAQGKVTFTNNGKDPVNVPSGTIIATTGGIQFTTGADFVVSSGTNNTFPGVPVSAQQPGESGNVPANSITQISAASLNSIAQENHTTPDKLSLTVTNPQATSGGGVTDAAAVTQQDLQKLTRGLHQKLQQQVNTWLGAQVHSGDLRGSLMPDVLGNSGPISEEQLSDAPSSGQAVTGGNFSGTLSLHVSILVVRASDLQKAAGSQLNAAALKLQPPSTLANQLPVVLTNLKSTPSKDGRSLAISAQASGEVYRYIPSQDVNDIRGALTGKGVAQAKGELQNSLARVGFVDAQINVTPGFLSILPLQAERIQVILQPVPQTTLGNQPNG